MHNGNEIAIETIILSYEELEIEKVASKGKSEIKYGKKSTAEKDWVYPPVKLLFRSQHLGH